MTTKCATVGASVFLRDNNTITIGLQTDKGVKVGMTTVYPSVGKAKLAMAVLVDTAHKHSTPAK